MSKADEMFEKLGYKKENSDFIFSRFQEEWTNIELDKTISFNTDYKYFSIIDNGGFGINIQELQAINEKVKELRLD